MIEFRIKEKTRSINESFRGGWQPRAAVAKRQRTKAMQACPTWPGGPLLVVRLTRLSRGTLDFSNLAGALKHVQDGVASRLKVDDASPLVEWRFEQAHGEAEVVVQIWRAGEEAPPLPVGGSMERRRGKTLAAVETDAVRPLRVGRESGNGQNRALRKVPFNEAMDALVPERMRTPRREDTPIEAQDFARVLNAQPNYAKPRTHVCGKNGCRKHRPCEVHEIATALSAAKEAGETFAPAEPTAWVPARGGPFTPAPVPPCWHCGDAYDPKCHAPNAPRGAVSCRKDVHCPLWDGHGGECTSLSPRACTT